MKRSIVFTALILIAFAGLTQKTDTTCIPNQDLRRKLVQLEECKVVQLELQQKRDEVKDLLANLATREVRIQGLEQTVETQKVRLSVWGLQEANYQAQLLDRDKGIKSLEKALRQQKTKTIITGAGGILASVAVFLIAIH